MIKNKYSLFFIISIAAIFMLNAVILYTNLKQQDHFSYFKRQDYLPYIDINNSLSKSDIEYINNILASYDIGSYEKALEQLSDEVEELRKYCEARAYLNKDFDSLYYSRSTKENALEIADKYSFTEKEAENRMNLISHCINRLRYAVNYPEYLSSIKNNVSRISGISIFNNKIRKSFVRAENEFYGLEGIPISAELDISIIQLFNDYITDILGVITAVLCGLFLTIKYRSLSLSNSAAKGKLLAYTLLLALGIASMYISNIFITDNFIELGKLGRSIQSIEKFQSCPYIISVGTVAAVRIAFKTAACVIIYYLCTAIFSAGKIWRSALIILTASAAEILLYIADSKIRFITLFKSENIIGKYTNIFVFDESINPSVILFVFCIALFLCSGFMAFKTVNRMLLLSKEEAEKKYYSEINDKYTETRLIRHDIKNHLIAVAMLMDDGKISEARKYLDDISVEIDNARMPLQTGSAALDALLFKKLEDMKKSRLSAEIDFNVSFADLNFSEYDLCSIFGNILDNAIEAVSKLGDEDKKIKLSVKRQMDMICIFCENSYKEINRNFSTLKQDKSIHGLGLSRVRRTAEKYGGTVDITTENQIFAISIILSV